MLMLVLVLMLVLDGGGVTSPGVTKAIMQTGFTALPELDDGRDQTHAAPEGGHGDAVDGGEATVDGVDAGVEEDAVGWLDDGGLGAGPGADLGAADARVEVALALLGREPFDPTFHPDLPLEFAPPERQGGVRVRAEIGRLAAAGPVRVDDEAARVQLFEVHHPRRHPSARQAGRGEGGGFGQRHLVRLRVLEPGVELAQRVGRQVAEG